MVTQKKVSKNKPIGKFNKPSENIKIAPDDWMEKAYRDLKPGFRSSNAEFDRMLRASAHPPPYRAQVAEVHETRWKEVKTEIINKRKSPQQPQDKDAFFLSEKLSRPFVGEREEEKLINNPHRYHSLMMRIEDGLETGLSEDDRVTVLAALDCAVERNADQEEIANLKETWKETMLWREAWFAGGETTCCVRFKALEKRLGLKRDCVSRYRPSIKTVATLYQLLIGEIDPMKDDLGQLPRISRGKYYEIIRLMPAKPQESETKKMQAWRKIAVRLTADVFHFIGKRDGFGIMFDSDYACYQALRGKGKGGLKNVPRFYPVEDVSLEEQEKMDAERDLMRYFICRCLK